MSWLLWFAGRVLNRFSKDLGFLDDLLPYQFYDYLFVSEWIICPVSCTWCPTHICIMQYSVHECLYIIVCIYCIIHLVLTVICVCTVLPVSLMLKIFLRCLSVLVITGIANYYIFIPVVLVLVVFLLLRAYYLTSAREIKRLEAIGEYAIMVYEQCVHIARMCIVAWLFCANLSLAVAVENYQDRHIWDRFLSLDSYQTFTIIGWL